MKAKLFTMQENAINELQEKIEVTHTMVDIDEDDTLDPDDYSHQYETGEIEQLMKVQLNKSKRNLDRLKSLDFEKRNTIGPGAYIETDQFNFFIGLATVPFDVDGKHVIGISLGSPIYTMMVDKKEGDTFSFCGVNYEIKSII